MKLDENLKKIDEITKKMENPDISMNEGVDLYEQGVKLAKECLGELNEIKGKVNILKKELDVFKKNKVNRISIGIETVNPKYLKLIERNHTKEEVKEKINLVKKYFSNINVDFMYGFNNQTIEELKSDLDFFKELDVPHISIYSLILEPNTKLFINNMTPLDEEIESNM